MMLGRIAGRRARPAQDDCIEAVARTHVGTVRSVNEDRFLVRSDRGLWAVADGMGGHQAGEQAAEMAIAMLNDLADGAADLTDGNLTSALESANNAIFETNRKAGYSGGTTIVVARREADHAVVYWAGDSRAYWMQGDTARLLTRDHSVVQEWVDAGLLTEDAARDHPRANVITRALGADVAVRLDRVRCRFGQGDRLLLCSDGLSRSQRLGDFADRGHDVAGLADRLLTAALQRDGSDNATLVAIERRGD